MPRKSGNRKGPKLQQTVLYDRITKTETTIISKIDSLKHMKKVKECRHLLNLSAECEDYDPTVNYYERYWRRFLENEVWGARIGELHDLIMTVTQELSRIEVASSHAEALREARGST